MAEKQKKPKMQPMGSSGPGTPFDDDVAEQKTGNVDVIHGVYAHSLPLAGMTVKQARKELINKMNIDPKATAVVDGTEVDDSVALHEGQVLTFVKPAGEKG
jgi:hypothetical protein